MIKKDFEFVMKVLNGDNNTNFKTKWDDNLGTGVCDPYVVILTNRYNEYGF
jgi:hypothetical protein